MVHAIILFVMLYGLWQIHKIRVDWELANKDEEWRKKNNL